MTRPTWGTDPLPLPVIADLLATIQDDNATEGEKAEAANRLALSFTRLHQQLVGQYVRAVSDRLDEDDLMSEAMLATLGVVRRCRVPEALSTMVWNRARGAIQDYLTSLHPFSNPDVAAIAASRSDEPTAMEGWRVARANSMTYTADVHEVAPYAATAEMPARVPASLGREMVWAAIRTLPRVEGEAVERALMTGGDLVRPHARRGWSRLVHPTRAHLVADY